MIQKYIQMIPHWSLDHARNVRSSYNGCYRAAEFCVTPGFTTVIVIADGYCFE